MKKVKLKLVVLAVLALGFAAGFAETVKVETVKPQTGQLEYSVWDGATLLFHGFTTTFTTETNLAQFKALCEADASGRGFEIGP